MTESKEKISRLRWQCRRGMLELDSLLQPFFEQKYAQLSESEQILFEKLLTCHDQDLYLWFLSYQSPPAEFVNIIQQILSFRSHK